MDPIDFLAKMNQLPQTRRLKEVYAECLDAFDQGPAAFSATVIRWLNSNDELLFDNDGKSFLAGAQGDGGSTLLHWAAMSGDRAVVEALLDHGADRHQRSNGMSPKEIAIEYGHAHLLEHEGRGLL